MDHKLHINGSSLKYPPMPTLPQFSWKQVYKLLNHIVSMSHSIVSCLTGFLPRLVRSARFLLLVTVVKIEAIITIYTNQSFESVQRAKKNCIWYSDCDPTNCSKL